MVCAFNCGVNDATDGYDDDCKVHELPAANRIS